MAEDDIYNNKSRYEKLRSNLRNLLIRPPESTKRGNRKYYIRNPANLHYFDKLFAWCEARDLSFIRRIRLAASLLFTCHHTDKNLAELSRTDIDAIIAQMHTKFPSPKSKSDYITHIKHIWKLLFPENDIQGRPDETVVPYPVRHLSPKIDVSRQTLRNDRLGFDEFTKITDFFSHDPRMQAYLTFAMESLGRPQEILYINLKNVELFDNYAKIWITEHGKEGVGMLQCIDSFPYLARWLDQHPYRHDKTYPLFVNLEGKNSGKRLSPANINKMVKTACRKLSIDKKVTCYSFKRNGVTFRRLRGDSDVEIQHAARWNSTAQLKTYDLSNQDDAFKLELVKRGLIKGYDKEPKPTMDLKQCLYCNVQNGFSAEICSNCKRPLDREAIKKQEEEKNTELQKVQDRLVAMESFLNKIVQDEGARKSIATTIRRNNLKDSLVQLKN